MTGKVFLSASVPLPDRDQEYFRSSDPIAIREAVKALAIVAVEKELRIVFGGHPAITPILGSAFSKSGRNPTEFVTLYQSDFFRNQFPEANNSFGRYIRVPAIEGSRSKSLELLRQRMFEDHRYNYVVFIGGMEGSFEEYKIAQKMQPKARLLPVESTGGASKSIFDEHHGDPRLKTELTYQTLFRVLLR